MSRAHSRSSSAGQDPVERWQTDVVGYEKKDGYVYYVFKLVSPRGIEKSVSLRYSALRDLHLTLCRLYPEAMKQFAQAFPAKSLLSGQGVIKERMFTLDKYFQAAFADPFIGESIALRQLFHITEGLVWYRTLSACPVCIFVDMVGIKWIPAVLKERDERILLTVLCNKHGHTTTIFCESARFFFRLAKRQLLCNTLNNSRRWLGSSTTSLAKAKEVALNARSECTVMDISLTENGALISDQRIVDICESIRHSTLILKVQSKLETDIIKINDKLHKIMEQSNGHAIVAEMPHDRLIQLSRIQRSVLLKRRVTPAVTYFLRRGEEIQCHRELVETIGELTRIQGIDFHVYLHLERPFPNLTSILAMLRKHNDIVRVIRFCLSRPREEILRSSKLQSTMITLPFQSPGARPALLPSVDFYELTQHVQASTEGEIGPDDFVSQSAGTLLEPMLPLLGYSRFKFRPCDSAGAMAVLLHSREAGSISANRLLDLEAFIDELQPISSKMNAISMAQLIKKTFKRSLRPEALKAFPSLANLASESISTSSPPDVLRRSQLLVVQRAVDLAALDMEHVLAPMEYAGFVTSLLEGIQ